MFIKNYLKISDWKTKFLKDRLAFLHEYIRSSVINIPFQNVSVFGNIPQHLRDRPTFRMLLETNLEGKGGMCAHNNYFSKMIFQTLGYATEIVSGTFRRTGIENSHWITVVKIPPPHSRDKKTIDRYLVDLGCGIPLHEPILLNDLPFKGRAGGCDFRYEFMGDDGLHMRRVHDAGDIIVGKKPMGYNNPQDYEIYLKPREMHEFYPSQDKVFTSFNLYIHYNPYLFRYLKINEDDDDFQVVIIRGTDVILGTKETRKVESFKDFFDIKPAIKEYFPMVPTKEVDFAMENFTRSTEEMLNKKASTS